MSGKVKRRNAWALLASSIGGVLLLDHVVPPLYRSISPSMKYGVAVVLTIAVTTAFIWLIRATLSD